MEINIYYIFGPEKCDDIYNSIRCIIEVKSGITYIVSFNYAKIKVDSYDYLPLGKSLTFHNVIILIKSVWNVNKNNYDYTIFLEKGLNELPRSNDNK